MKTFNEYLQEEIQDYNEYLEAIKLYENYKKGLLTEGVIDSLTGNLKDKFNFIKDLATASKQKLEDVIKLFKNSKTYEFFKRIGWSIAKLYAIVKQGYKVYVNFGKVIHKFLLDNKYTSDATKWTDKQVKALHDYLETHPTIKHLAAPMIAAFLMYMWIYSANLGEIGDFDVTDIFKAIAGKYDLYDLLGNGQLLKVIVTLVTGVVFKTTFPYPTENDVKFLIGIMIALTRTLDIPTKFHKLTH